jgi:predicted alpha/beta-fold hydrolase
VVIHGLGSDHDRPYTRTGAHAALSAGAAVLRIELRGGGADPRGLYHAGLLTDLEAVLASPALQHFKTIHVMGYSLGGHLAMVLGVETTDPRIGRVAALCAPLNLAATQVHIDDRRRSPYRVNVLAGLKASYRVLAERMDVPCPWPVVKRIRTIYDWDERIVVPYFGFGSVERYYATVSAGPKLGELKRDALFVATVQDPMIPVDSLRPYLDAPRLTTRLLESGGHVYFPKNLHLGLGHRLGVEAQVVDWLLG